MPACTQLLQLWTAESHHNRKTPHRGKNPSNPAVSSHPSKQEQSLLTTLYQHQHARFQDAPDDAKALISVGASALPKDIEPAQLAAWTQVARAILNLYETTSRF